MFGQVLNFCCQILKTHFQHVGFKPDSITYSSDNFQRLYDLAEKLVKLDKAYVCHCPSEELKKQRGGEEGKETRYRCEHADQAFDANLAKFRDMRDGKYAAKTAYLRMKQDITNPNPQMWDIAAYRIPSPKDGSDTPAPHYRTGDTWKIYPTYDFAHCLCDSFEGITHSLCTTEFILSRESYEWLNTSLGVYEPMQREYGMPSSNLPIERIYIYITRTIKHFGSSHEQENHRVFGERESCYWLG